jgi:hypothetical protein
MISRKENIVRDTIQKAVTAEVIRPWFESIADFNLLTGEEAPDELMTLFGKGDQHLAAELRSILGPES